MSPLKATRDFDILQIKENLDYNLDAFVLTLTSKSKSFLSMVCIFKCPTFSHIAPIR